MKMMTEHERELWDIIHKQARQIGRLQGSIQWLISAGVGSGDEDSFAKSAIACAEKAMQEE
jgi:hypothetical protein